MVAATSDKFLIVHNTFWTSHKLSWFSNIVSTCIPPAYENNCIPLSTNNSYACSYSYCPCHQNLYTMLLAWVYFNAVSVKYSYIAIWWYFLPSGIATHEAITSYGAAVCDIICLWTVVLSGGKTMWWFAWQQEEICLIFTNRPCIGFWVFTVLITSKCYL